MNRILLIIERILKDVNEKKVEKIKSLVIDYSADVAEKEYASGWNTAIDYICEAYEQGLKDGSKDKEEETVESLLKKAA